MNMMDKLCGNSNNPNSGSFMMMNGNNYGNEDPFS